MSETKIFPPPWAWEYHPDTREAIALTSTSGDVLLATGDETSSWLAASDAHMRALTATPDLLAALRDCIDVMENDLKGLSCIQPELRVARAAYAKATGETP